MGFSVHMRWNSARSRWDGNGPASHMRITRWATTCGAEKANPSEWRATAEGRWRVLIHRFYGTAAARGVIASAEPAAGDRARLQGNERRDQRLTRRVRSPF